MRIKELGDPKGGGFLPLFFLLYEEDHSFIGAERIDLLFAFYTISCRQGIRWATKLAFSDVL